LTKRFGKTVAVNDVNISVKDRDFVVLVGPSGCGKTTTLRCIAGLEYPDEGEIYIGDKLVNELSPKERDIAMVFQSYALYPHMTVFNNIAFPLKQLKTPKNEIPHRVKKTAELLQIDHLLDRKPGQLSGGERQRTALGRSIVREPNVFLMDEPLSNLDAKLRVYMRVELKRLQKELGITTIYVTHDQVEAMTMADEIAIMNLGVLQQIGQPMNVYEKPANFFVAGFIGSPPMGFLDCTLIEKKGSQILDASYFKKSITNDTAKIIRENTTSPELILGIRPECLFIATKSQGDIDTVIYEKEPLGDEIIFDVKLGETIIKIKSPPKATLKIGDKVSLGFEEENMHIFDKKTEKAIF
jgi:multiple sugar transport system ATP-binding protein